MVENERERTSIDDEQYFDSTYGERVCALSYERATLIEDEAGLWIVQKATI